MQTFEGRARSFVVGLNLDASQQEKFDELLTQAMQQRAEIRRERRPDREKLFAELVKDQPDEEILRSFIETDRGKARRAFKVEQMRKFMTILRPDQRQLFLDRMHRRWDRKSQQSVDKP